MQACCSAESRGKLARSHGGTRCVERSSSTVAMSKTGRRWTWVRPAFARAREVTHAVRGRPGERGVRPALRGRDRCVVDGEVADVELVERDPFRARPGRAWCTSIQPAGRSAASDRLTIWVRVEFRASASGVRVGDEVVLDLPGRRGEDLHVIEVVLVLPGRGSGHAPDARRVVAGHGVRRGRCRRGIRVQAQRDGFRRGCPQADRRHAAGPGDAQGAVVGVQVVEDARDLDPGRDAQVALRVGRGDRQLALQRLGDRVEIAGGDAERLVVGEVRPLRLELGREAARDAGQRDRLAAGDPSGDGKATVGGVVERVLAAGQRLDVPGERVLGQPVRLLARQVGIRARPGLDRQQVLGHLVGVRVPGQVPDLVPDVDEVE